MYSLDLVVLAKLQVVKPAGSIQIQIVHGVVLGLLGLLEGLRNGGLLHFLLLGGEVLHGVVGPPGTMDWAMAA